MDFFCYVCKVPYCISEGVSRENIEFGLEFGNNTRSYTLPKETKKNFKERGKVILEICGQHIQQIPKRRMIPTHANVHIQFRYLLTHQIIEIYA